MKKSKGNLLITYILLIALSVSVFSYLYLIGFRLKESGIRVSEIESFYNADAGLNKAIWYLGTPTGQGGKGATWRTAGTWEAFGWGRYYIIVRDYVTNEVQIISTGEVGGITKTISQVVSIGGLPIAFDYSVYSNSASGVSGNTIITGDMYVNGNVALGGNAHVQDGYLYHPTGTTITKSGNATYTDGGQPDPNPSFPVVDTSYYDNLITLAQDATAGNVTYSNSTTNLNGGTIYVKGNVTISGNTTFNGPGVVVATGTISISGNTYSSSSVKFISAGQISLSGNTYTDGALYYSSTSLAASGNTRVSVGGFITKGSIALSGNLNMSGLVYSLGSTTMSGNAQVTGTLVATSVAGLSGNAHITYDASVLPTEVPIGFTGTSMTVKKGSWKGN
jgi:formylmethanofuran dehydrogenase subunit C